MKLAELLTDHRWAKKMGLRELAKSIGITHSALARIEKGLSVDEQNLIRVLFWLFGK